MKGKFQQYKLKLKLVLTTAYVALTLICPLAQAKFTLQNQIYGIKNQAILANINAALDAETKQLKRPTATDIENLYNNSQRVIRDAIQPYGYFSPTINSRLRHKKNLYQAEYAINLGRPVIVRSVDVKITGPGKNYHRLVKLLKYFPIHQDDILNTESYKQAKQKLFNSATNHGYVKAKISLSKILINRDKYCADITLHIASGERYKFGLTRFSQNPFSVVFLQRFMPYEAAEFYSAQKLQKLQNNLTNSNYFRQVSVTPQINQTENLLVPIEVHVLPKNSRRYTVGGGYGTDTGPRGLLGLELRNLTRNGQYAKGFIRGSAIDSNGEIHYIIPGHNPVTDRYDIGLAGSISQQKYGDTRSASLSAGYTTTILSGWQQIMRLNLQHESDKAKGKTNFTSTTFLIPSIGWLKTKTNDPIRTTQGWKLNVHIQGASKALGSKTNFLQTRVDAKFIHPFFSNNTLLLLRGTYAITMMKDFEDLPLTFKYYTGGAQTVRGYAFQSLGPGRNMLTGSIEVRQRIHGNFYAAVFADAGDVSDSFKLNVKKGLGVGVAWLSPIGTMELSIAKAMDLPGKPNMLQFSMGPEF